MPNTTNTSTRLYSIDVLRGIAALTIVFWHWQHFFYINGGTIALTFKVVEQPLFYIFSLFYEKGGLAVDLFFIISGFIFFRIYSQPISQRKVQGSDFFVSRFTRLYPLHFITLIIVALQQLVYQRINGGSFVYLFNDLYHFILNIFLLSSVGLEKGYSFNAPIWSVSVEVCTYTIFFFLCRFSRPKFIVLAGLSLFGFILKSKLYSPIGQGLQFFFLGGCVYHVYLLILSMKYSKIISRVLAALVVSLWISLFSGSLSLDFAIKILFALTVLTLVLIETLQGSLGKRLSILGDISYSSYLWHFPLQLLFIIATTLLKIDREIYNSPLILIGFFSLLIPISFVSHKYIEMPIQRCLRDLWVTFRSNEKSSTTV